MATVPRGSHLPQAWPPWGHSPPQPSGSPGSPPPASHPPFNRYEPPAQPEAPGRPGGACLGRTALPPAGSTLGAGGGCGGASRCLGLWGPGPHRLWVPRRESQPLAFSLSWARKETRLLPFGACAAQETQKGGRSPTVCAAPCPQPTLRGPRFPSTELGGAPAGFCLPFS